MILIVVTSLLVGIATAAVSTLVVLPGATESVITGALLVACGLGWATLAILPEHLSDRPQRWAAVPALLLGVSGVIMLLVRPGQGALAILAWFWPPVVAALVVWTWAQARRHLRGSSRWLLASVMVVLATASVATTAENMILQRDRLANPAPGQLHEVAGRALHLDCHGEGSPTVVLVNGLSEASASWARISAQLAPTTRVCAYDRAGQAWSEDTTAPQDAVQVADELHAVLAAAGEQGPFVLAGHSIGGLYAMVYAHQYPDDVAGMTLLDSTSPRQFSEIPAYPGQYAALLRAYSLLPTFARMGAGHLAVGTTMADDARERVLAVTSTPRAARNARDEVTTLPSTMRSAQRLTTLGDAPLAVVTASGSLEGTGWDTAQRRMSLLSTNARHSVVTSSHFGLLDDEEPARQSVLAITEVVESARTGHPLINP